MTKRSSSLQRGVLTTTLGALIMLLLLKGCDSTASNIDLSTATLDPATTGFTITGNAAKDAFGHSLSTIGDINNDGYDDIIIGASSKNNAKGAAYVIYGGPTSSISNIDLSTTTLDPATTGFMITGNADVDTLGWSVSKAGDINSDGYGDIIIGAPSKGHCRGAAYVIYGGSKSSMSNIDLSLTVLDPLTTGFMVTGKAVGDFLGVSVSGAGDINQDGYDDIIVGAYAENTSKGAAYVIYGGPKSSLSNIDFTSTTLNPLTTGFKITGKIGENLGHSVSSAGDINHDGYDDILIGAYLMVTSYVIYGGEKSSMSNFDLSSTKLDPATTGFMITGNFAYAAFGSSVSTAGDINNDGYDDIIIGAFGKISGKGAAYVIYGGSKSSMSNIDLSSTTLNPLTTGFTITGNATGDFFGWPVSTAGDINKDGFSDIIVGSSQKNGDQGAAYVIYGGPKSSSSNIDLSTATLDPATTGFMITGNAAGDQFGQAVRTAGDINKDGYDDLIVGAQGKNDYQGAAYVIYGGQKPSMLNIAF